MPVMLDLFSGLGGASQAMKERGWTVWTVELNPKLKPDIVADVRHLPLRPFPVDLLWASPPCEQYSRKWQFAAWHPNAPDPDLSIWQSALDTIAEWQPRYYCIKNVWAAQKAWGKATFHFGSRYLWTNIPLLGQPDRRPIKMGMQAHMWGANKNPRTPYAQSSKIEHAISSIIASAVETFL